MRKDVSLFWRNTATAFNSYPRLNHATAGVLTISRHRPSSRTLSACPFSQRHFSLTRLFRPNTSVDISTQAEAQDPPLDARPHINEAQSGSDQASPAPLIDISSASIAELTETAVPSAVDADRFVLRAYQTKMIKAVHRCPIEGHRRIAISAPTACGKTVVFTSMIPLIPDQFPPTPSFEVQEGASNQDRGNLTTVMDDRSASRRAPFLNSGEPEEVKESQTIRGQTLILVPSVWLAEQTEKTAKRVLGNDWSIEVEQAERRASGRADVTIATRDTLNNLDRLARFDPSKFKAVIVDEAHHVAAVSYLRILHYFDTSVQLPPSTEPYLCQARA
ncbi:hypothetical protein IAT40_001586 [Kwoniella sp. CBS 6097]